MPKTSKEAEQSTSYRLTESDSIAPKTKPAKNIRKKQDGRATNAKQKLSKKEIKELEKQQRQKAYVAPIKPLPIKPDPLDSTGLVYVLPGELVIVLRNLGKKAVKTRERALDELDSGWVNNNRGTGAREREQILIDMLPVWLSHLPQLLLHASRRIRLAAANVHRSFVSISAVLKQMKLQLEADSLASADVVGIWALATHDIDPAVGSVLAESWRKFLGTSSSSNAQIQSYAQRAILDPGGLYAYLNPAPPPPPVSTPTPHKTKSQGNQKGHTTSKGVKGKPPPTKPTPITATKVTIDNSKSPSLDEIQPDSLETDTDRDARIRVGGLGALAWVLSSTSSEADMLDVLEDAKLWTALAGHDSDSFGFEQPPVRKATWRLIGAIGGVITTFKASISGAIPYHERMSRFLRVLSSSVLRSAWAEQDAGVQGVMWHPLLRFLKDNPEAWQWEMEYIGSQINAPRRSRKVEAGSDSETGSNSEPSDDEAEGAEESTEALSSRQSSSGAYRSFLSFLARGCNGSPISAYPAIMVVLSTIPLNMLLASTVSSPATPFADLFSSFWAAVEPDDRASSLLDPLDPSNITTTIPNRIFSGSGADKASKAFVEAVLDCLVFLVRRTASQSHSTGSETTETVEAADTLELSTLIRTQINRVWMEVIGTTGDLNKDIIARKPVLRISPDVLGMALTRALRGLHGVRPQGPLYDSAWKTVAQLIRDCAAYAVGASSGTSSVCKDLSSFISGVLKAFKSESVDSADSANSNANHLLVNVFGVALAGCEWSLSSHDGSTSKGLGGFYLLTKLIQTLGFDSAILSASDSIERDVTNRIDTFVVQNAYTLLSFPSISEGSEGQGGREGLELLATYLLHRDLNEPSQPTESSQTELLWSALLEQVVEHTHSPSDYQKIEFAVVLGRLLSLLELIRSKRGARGVVDRLRPVTSELDQLVLEFARETVDASGSPSISKLNVVRDVLLSAHRTTTGDVLHPLLTSASLVNLMTMLIARFKNGVEGLLGISKESENQIENQGKEEERKTEPLDRIDRLLLLMKVILELPPVNIVDPDQSKPLTSSSSPLMLLPELPLTITSVLPCVFLLVHVLPRRSISQGESSATDDDHLRRDALCAKSQRIWESSIKSIHSEVHGGNRSELYPELGLALYSSITHSLRTLLSNANSRGPYWCPPEDVVEVFNVLRNSMLVKFLSESSTSTILKMNPLDALLPPQDSFDALLDALDGSPTSRSLGVVDELAGVASLFGPSSFAASSSPDDAQTYTRYALALLRIVSNDLGLAKGMLTTNSSSWWVLRHLLVLGVYAEGVTMVPVSHEKNPLSHLTASESARVDLCRKIIENVHQIVAYTFASAESAEGVEGREWRKDVCQMLSSSSDASLSTLPSLAAFLLSAVRFATKTDSYRDCRLLREVLSRVFQAGLGSDGTGGISEEEANQWLTYARRISQFEKEKCALAPLTGVTIMSTVVANLSASSSSSSSSSSTPVTASSFSRLERYRNELASSLLGVPPSRATSDGLRILLRLVLGTAPDVESEAEFLPVQRAVNVIKACQRWIEEGRDEYEKEETGEAEDGMEELESVMTLTFYHLAPILQNVAGSHWQFIFDVIENNIENCEFKFVKPPSASSSFPLQMLTLARTLRLIGHIQDLVTTNKSLRAEWSVRESVIMKGIRNMILDEDISEEESEAGKESEGRSVQARSVPEGVCRELVLELVANNLSNESLNYQTFPKMCHLLSSSNLSSSVLSLPASHTQIPSSSLSSYVSSIHHDQLAYQILHKAAKKRTEHFVLEAGVDLEGKVEAQLPKELVVLLQRSLNMDIDVEEGLNGDREHDIFVYLLGWMLFFDLFVDTSMKVRMRYIEQLRSSSLIEAHFIPSVISLLSLDRGIVRAYKLDMWAVDEFYVQFYEAGSLSGLQTFAAHLYYRALLTVPSLIYNWVLDCRDRQLSTTIASYTQSHFSPVLIRTELDYVKSPEAQTELASDENQLTVKVASGVVNEVTASYLVDEQQLEIRLRIPGDWPLHRIEIRDTKKVGVDDNRWRAWILGVQQTIWAQNGRIVDGLALFKKNVAGHFEGQVECAICYSLISVMDGSLPKKPCNTCKNRFHAGCLFKWFNSSHSSSCPLCRSNILH
ncbi:hypothetical protein J3R30DRAFT_3579883 [Lentinula aciculospora]|uniref:E3 ubiquitin-protein ligase listerin n=1 Tax=Lentinula aciculospora TaxID=153920 RepID=A0A9W8ZU30_9AGAR|nr:hypothetical protein J3R30DRAFT_3579883 [Lentinula aciculospora]